MFNITNVRGGDTKVEFNSVAGTLVKSCPESKIARFHQNSKLAEHFFDLNEPHRKVGYNVIKVSVLQVMLASDNNYLVEYIDVK